jgi:hypothetical protein
MDLLGGGGVDPPWYWPEGVQGGAIFHDKAKKIIRGKMRYSNLSNNMMISELWTTITIHNNNNNKNLYFGNP